MDLFTDYTQNLLPKDGEVYYFGKVLNLQQCQYFLEKLQESIEWKNDELIMFGKRIVTQRKVAWYGEKPYNYKYSNTTKTALPWTTELLELKELVEAKTNEKYDTCLLNLYHSGEEGMGWHADDEPDLKPNGTIASLSFGVSRKFVFKHKETQEKVEIMLEDGSLLSMRGKTQIYWLHALPKTKKVKEIRINLTFRSMNFN